MEKPSGVLGPETVPTGSATRKEKVPKKLTWMEGLAQFLRTNFEKIMSVTAVRFG